jgi:drug/metabolite transporter (DMT)-like permease
MNNIQKGILFTLLSAVFNSSTYLLSRLILNLTNVETMLVLWFFWGNIIFFFYMFLTKSLKQIFYETKRNLKSLAILGLINTVSVILWSYGILLGDLTNVTFLFRFEVIFAVLLGLILLKEKLMSLEILGIILAIIGAFVMVYSGQLALGLGDLIMLFAALTSAISSFVTKIYSKKISSFALAYNRSVFLFILIGIYSIALGKINFAFSTDLLILTLTAAFVGAFLGFVFFYKSLSFYELSKATSVRSVEPFFAVIFALIFLSVAPTLPQLFGGTLIVVGIIILSLAAGKKVK